MRGCSAGEPLACCEYCAFNPRTRHTVEEWFEPAVTHFCKHFRMEHNDGTKNRRMV